MRRTVQKYGVIIVIILAVILLFQKVNLFPSFKDIFKSQPLAIEETPIILKEINTLAQLITVTFTDELVMDTAKIGNGLPSLLPTGIGTMLVPGIDRLVMIGRGKVLAGTDLKNIRNEDIQVSGDSIHVILPHAEILQSIMNPSDIETFEESGTWDDAAATALKIKIRNEITQRAILQNILQQADERCRNIIGTFLKNTGWAAVRKFKIFLTSHF